MPNLPDEPRLAVLLLVNAGVLALAWRFVRRQGGRDPYQSLCDASLLWYAIQYISVGVPGMLGFLNAWTMLTLAVVLACLIQLVPGAAPDPLTRPDRSFIVVACILIGFLGSQLWNFWTAPPLANDPLIYHLPAAVQWIQTGRLGVFETWFHNPANTWSPLAGSMFITWLMAPLGNDSLARFVQMPAILFIFVLSIQIIRSFGASVTIASLLALAVVGSRPFMSQAALAKDDLFVVAFFASAMVAMKRERVGDRFGGWRLGISLGLLLATKYTALLSVPILLLAVDRASMRKWMIAALVAFVFASPWYIRNLLRTGNPLFPIEVHVLGKVLLPGLITMAAAPNLRSVAGVFHTFVDSYYGLTRPFALVMMLGALLGNIAFIARPAVMSSGFRRCLFAGPMLGVILFLWKSPYDEARFTLPAQMLLIIAVGLILPFSRKLLLILAVALPCIALATSFIPANLAVIAPAWVAAAVLAMLLVIAYSGLPQRSAHTLTGLLLATLGCCVYVNWTASLGHCRLDAVPTWTGQYGPLADAWKFVRDKIPEDKVLAYTNTSYVYPLYGYDLRRRVLYAPARPGLRSSRDLPRASEPLRAGEIDRRFTLALSDGADEATWMENLQRSGAEYIFVAKSEDAEPAEDRFIRHRVTAFEKFFENTAACIYRFRDSRREVGVLTGFDASLGEISLFELRGAGRE